MKPEISIIVTTVRNGGLDVLFNSLEKQTFKNFEVILSDGIYKYRKDIVKEKSKRYNFTIKHVEPTHNIFPKSCYCNANNTGIINASAKLILLLTDYTYLPPGCVQKHIDFHKENPQENIGYMCPHQYKALPELHPNFTPYTRPGDTIEETKISSEGFKNDLDSGKLEHVMWSIFKDDFNQDPELLPLDQMGNADTKLFMDYGPADPNAFNGKNESMKIEAALKVNGYDEDLDGTHCWQDNVFSDALVKKLKFTWIVDPSNKVYIINPRYYMPLSRRVRHYLTNESVWTRRKETNYDPLPNNWNLRDARNKILYNTNAIVKKHNKISVIVVTNRIGGLDVLFDSLENQIYKNFELILVDAIYKYRKDLIIEKAKQYNFTIKHVEPIDNTFPISNYCRSINTGLFASEGDLVYFTCDYSYLHQDTLLMHANFHENTPNNYMLTAPVNYYGINSKSVSNEFCNNRKYGHWSFDTKNNLLVATESDYISIHDTWTDNYKEDLDKGLLNNFMWSIFNKDFDSNAQFDYYYDMDSPATNIDKRYGTNLAKTIPELCSLKNDSFKLNFILNANGLDETLDSSHGFQDSELSRRLDVLHNCVFNSIGLSPVSIFNIRYYLEPRKVINGYSNYTKIVNKENNQKKPIYNLINLMEHV